MSLPTQTLIDLLSRYFATRKDVRFSCVFGSRARGDFSENSDLDIGIMYQSVPDLLSQGGDVTALESLTGFEVDITVLNDLPSLRPELAYHIACDAVHICAKDIDELYEFKMHSKTAMFSGVSGTV